jgi:hypothetical protein
LSDEFDELEDPVKTSKILEEDCFLLIVSSEKLTSSTSSKSKTSSLKRIVGRSLNAFSSSLIEETLAKVPFQVGL